MELSDPNTAGTEESVRISEVSLFQGLNYPQELFLGERNGVLIREVSSFQVSLQNKPPPTPQNIDLHALTGWIPERISLKKDSKSSSDGGAEKDRIFKKLETSLKKGGNVNP